jgi:hypothetical protein
MVDTATHASEHRLPLAKGGGELAPLALLDSAGQDLRDQIRNLLRQVFRRELGRICAFA